MAGGAARRAVLRCLTLGVLLVLRPALGAAQDTAVALAPRRGAPDSAAGESARALAARSRGLRVVVSLRERRLWVIADADTLLSASVAVGSDAVLEYGDRRWEFRTPRGVRTVVRKDSLPVWVPPDWHYYEVAREHGLTVRRLSFGRAVTLADGRRLEVRRGGVGVTDLAGAFAPLPVDEEIVFDGALFIPPLGTVNRRIPGELGRYRLDLGDGVSLHGTPHLESIGRATTHGCIRLGDDEIAWIHAFVPVGTPAFIY